MKRLKKILDFIGFIEQEKINAMIYCNGLK